ncbi:MAG: hypothetical protein V4489_08495 [Chlamydiota bacterium]
MLAVQCVLLLICMSSFSAMEYEDVANEITRKTIQKVAREKKMSAIGIGGGMLGDIYKMSISFQFFHPTTQMEARQLLVDVVSTYLQEINSNQKIRPYLHDYPFTAKNVQIDIWIKNPDRSDVAFNQIDYMVALSGELYYDLPIEPGTYKRRLLHKETYAEAVEILQDQKEKHESVLK